VFGVAEQRLVGDKHSRLVLTTGRRRLAAIVFNDSGPFPESIRAVYRPEVNSYRGLDSLQLLVESWQPA
jgi:single-stranded-DNA-specific exonuclease